MTACLCGNYEAAVLSAGFGGFALGATPTAIANMTAVTKKHGPAPNAFIILPLVAAFFVDLANRLLQLQTGRFGYFGGRAVRIGHLGREPVDVEFGESVERDPARPNDADQKENDRDTGGDHNQGVFQGIPQGGRVDPLDETLQCLFLAEPGN